MENETKCWCRNCGIELPPSHTGPCPECGKSGKDCKVTASAVVGMKASLSGKYKPKWSSESLALFFGIVAIFLAIIVPGIIYLLPFSPGINYATLVGFLLIVGGIFWWQRYHVLMMIRWVESKFGGERKF